MKSNLPLWQHDLTLIGLAIVLLFALGLVLRGRTALGGKPIKLGRLMALLVGWQLLMAVLALAGYFAEFSQPWRALPTIGLTLALTAYTATRTRTLAALQGAPAWVWPALQSFRLPLELLLYSLFLHGVIGRQMTFSGYNFDILVGLTAPLMAGLLYLATQMKGQSTWVSRISLLWNLAGLALLLNILVIAVLSVPFPFQVFLQEPANRMVGAFPFIWLPTFFIPLALFSHLIALRLAWRGRHLNLHNTTLGASV